MQGEMIENDAWIMPQSWQILTARFYKFRGKVIEVRKCSDDLWRDIWGCIYSLADDENSFDAVDRCGVGDILSLPDDHPANEGCRPHEHKYASKVYQLYHTRREADDELERDQKLLGYPIFGWFARGISRLLGWALWENKKTR